MSLTAGEGRGPGPSLEARVAIAVAALGLVAGVVFVLGALFAPALPPPPARSPFGVGMREVAPAATGLGAWLIDWQSALFRELTQATRQALSNPASAWTLVAGSFLYGLVHAAGPGHGKAVISAYIVADGRSLRRGVVMSVAAALLQALVAILLVGLATLVFSATARQVDGATRLIEWAVFAAMAAAGLVVLWRKAGALADLGRADAAALAACGPSCDQPHMPDPAAIGRIGSLREAALVVLAAGARPCMGAIVVLTFAALNGLFLVGVASALAMAAGVALMTSGLAGLAVGFKALALRLAGGRGLGGARALLALECLAAALVAVLGLTLLLGMGSAPSGA